MWLLYLHFLLVGLLLSTCQSLQLYHKIAIVGMNDIHGTAFPTLLFRQDTNETYKYGGLVYMARLIEILQEDNPDKILILDAGDQFQGGIESSSLVSSGQIMNDFYNLIGLKGSAIGNHEFDFGPSFLENYLSNRYSDTIAANLRSESGQSNFLTNQKSIKIYQINDFKIGVIGLATVQTLISTKGFVKHLFPNYQFLQYKDVVISLSAKLKQEGADMIIILSHVGNLCQFNLTYGNWTKENSKQVCNKDQITQLIDSIPQGTVDAIIQGHRHSISHYFYRGIPIMGVISGGYYFNTMHITYQKNTKKIKQIIIEGPIPVCQKVFQNTKTCNYLGQAQIQKAGKLINWRFHGHDVYAQPILDRIFEQKWRPLMLPYFRQICKNQVYLAIDTNSQTQLGNLITSLMHEVVPDADFVILNPGFFRTIWVPGILQYQHFYSMFPFSQLIQTFQITGKELLETLNIIQSSRMGFYQIWNLYNQLKIITQNQTKQFISATFYDGTKIDNTTTYKGISTDFLLNGGDDFKQVLKSTYNLRNETTIGDFRQLIQPKLSKLKTIAKNIWIDPIKPRLNITVT